MMIANDEDDIRTWRARKRKRGLVLIGADGKNCRSLYVISVAFLVGAYLSGFVNSQANTLRPTKRSRVTSNPSSSPPAVLPSKNPPVAPSRPSPEISIPPSDNLSRLPSSAPSGMPSDQPTPDTSDYFEQTAIEMTLKGLDSTVDFSAISGLWQTITSQQVQRYWNDDVPLSPVFIGSVRTRLVSQERIITTRYSEDEVTPLLPDTELEDENQTSHNLGSENVRLIYSQVIYFAWLSNNSDGETLFTVPSKELFSVPFVQNPLPYTTLLMKETGNSRPIWLEELYVDSPPTPAPTIQVSPIEKQRNFIIISVVSVFAVLILCAGGHIVYLIHFKGSNPPVEEIRHYQQPDDNICNTQTMNDTTIMPSPDSTNYGTRLQDDSKGFERANPPATITSVGPTTEMESNPMRQERQVSFDNNEPSMVMKEEYVSNINTGEVCLYDDDKIGRLIDPLDHPPISYTTFPSGPLTWSVVDDGDIAGNELLEFDEGSFRSSMEGSSAGSAANEIVDTNNNNMVTTPTGGDDAGELGRSLDESESGPDDGMMFANMGNFQMEIQHLE